MSEKIQCAPVFPPIPMGGGRCDYCGHDHSGIGCDRAYQLRQALLRNPIRGFWQRVRARFFSRVHICFACDGSGGPRENLVLPPDAIAPNGKCPGCEGKGWHW